jgi:Skp family chaperone for outer membrane proteins
MPDYLSALTSRLSWKVAAIAAAIIAAFFGVWTLFTHLGAEAALKKRDAQIASVKGELMTCQTDLAAANHAVDSQNAAIMHLSEKAKEAEAKADAERAKNAKTVKTYQNRIAWLRSQTLSTEQCPGVRSMAVEYLTGERKESVQ